MSEINTYLSKCREAIHNAINDQDISTGLATFGYDQDKIMEGKGLYDAAKAADDTQNNLHAKDRQASDDYKQLRKQVNDTYTKHLDVARVAFEDNTHAYNELLLNGKRERGLGEWEKQCGTFYRVLIENATLQAIFNNFIPQTEVTATNASFLHVLQLHENYTVARAEAQDATDVRKKAIRNLRKWMKAFHKIARVAFADSPQKLEKVGIKA
ncbi:MAG: hypothetical protein KDD94_03465 [Calditrichaeota bacterium]|nr:hypothetical protein [Calditrichota bacterium]